MKRILSIKHRPFSYFQLLGVFALFIFAPLSWADSECAAYTETLSTSTPTLFGPFSGPSVITLDGVASSASFTTVLLGSPSSKEDGGIKAKFADFWVFPDGQVLTAIARVETFPPDPANPAAGTFTAKVRFTGGSGPYENVHGKAKLIGTFAFDPSVGLAFTESTSSGKLCGFGDSDSDSQDHNP